LVEKRFNFIVPGGGATGGPPIGPSLGPMGVNIMLIVAEINKQTGEYKGTPVPVDVFLDTDTHALLTQAVGVQKGSGTPHSVKVGDLAFEDLVGVVKKKKAGLYAVNLKAATREVLGTCQSMGVTVDGKPAKEVQDLIKSGAYDAQLKED